MPNGELGMEYKAKQICVLSIVTSRQDVINTFGLSPARSGSTGVHVAQLKFSPQEIEQVRNIDLLHVVQGYGVELKKQGREYVGLCPFHADKSPSLRVHPDNGWRCSPCDDDGHAIDFVMKCLGEPDPKKGFVVAMNQLLGKAPARFTPPPQRAPAPEEEPDGWERLTDMAPASPPPKPWRQCHGKPFTDRHEFRDADGTLIGFVDRFKGDDGKVTIPWTCWINKETGEEEWRRKGFLDPRPLYGRDKLAKYPEARVLVVEGERTADKAQAHFIAAGILLDRLVVVSWHGGTGVVDQVDLAPLHGRNVCAWPDSDQKVYGKDHPQAGEVKPFIEQGGTIAMLDVYAAIREHCTDVKFVIPPGAPGRSTGLEVKDGWDLADEFPPGFNPRSYIQKGSERVVMASVIQGQRDAARATATPTPTPAQASNQQSGELTEPTDPGTRDAMGLDANSEPETVPRFSADWIDDAWGDMKPNDWLVDGIVERDSTMVLFGEPGHGKSFIAISIAIAVATGITWFGSDVEQGAVFYMAGEGLNGILRRIKAFEIVHKMSTSGAPLAITNGGTALTDKLVAKEVAAVFRKMSKERGVTPALIIVDTLARHYLGDENSSEAMGAFIANLDQELRREWKCAVLIVHHAGKDATRGMRGSSALNGAADSAFQSVKGDDNSIRLFCTKMKEAEPTAPMAFRLQGADLPIVDKKGNVSTSAAAVSIDYTDAPKPGVLDGGTNQKKFWQGLLDLTAEYGERLKAMGYDKNVPRVTLKDLRERTGLERNAFWKVKDGYLKAGKIVVDGPHVSISGAFS